MIWMLGIFVSFCWIATCFSCWRCFFFNKKKQQHKIQLWAMMSFICIWTLYFTVGLLAGRTSIFVTISIVLKRMLFKILLISVLVLVILSLSTNVVFRFKNLFLLLILHFSLIIMALNTSQFFFVLTYIFPV